MNDSEFDDLMKAVEVEFPLPRSFKQGVWHRIESGELTRNPAFTVIGHPWLSGLGIAAAAVVGLWLGAVSTPQTKHTPSAYAESISPFSHSSTK